ncbi:hypothetical protein [Agrobacterium tumefaciens]|uniref:PIN domain-containing protein n=1 Tax=Agrobacterium tumefaciens TaxID=358 RepID=A0A176XIV1_AGRTU|nr:hypothetical protein [Agrobacterium tumefaciens]OAE49175.1 hypothetical protein A7J57_00735 [Agrobacterium tumefaciens]
MKQITVGVDTNVLLHYGQIKLLDWRKIFEDITHLRVLVARQVQREMDEQKDRGKGYIQTRAKEYQRLLLESETRNYAVTFEHRGVEVTIEFLRHTRNSDLDGDLFDLTSPDQKIAAEYYRVSRETPDLVVFANDTGTIMAAKDAKMITGRPEPAWKRVEPEDEAVKELREENQALKRQVGASPKIEFSNFCAEIVQRIPVGFAEGFDIHAYLKDQDGRIAATTCLASVDDLVRMYGLEARDPFGLNLAIFNRTKLTEQELNQYEERLADFDRFFQNMGPDQFLSSLQVLATPYLLNVDVSNIGTAMEERVCVELTTHRNCTFWSENDCRYDNNWGLSKPDEPKPMLSIPALPGLHGVRDRGTPDHLFGEPEVFGRGQRFRCRSILHGHSASVRAVIAHDEGGENDPTELMVSIIAMKLVEPITRKVTFRRELAYFDGNDIDELIAARTTLMDDEQAEILERAIRVDKGGSAREPS